MDKSTPNEPEKTADDEDILPEAAALFDPANDTLGYGRADGFDTVAAGAFTVVAIGAAPDASLLALDPDMSDAGSADGGTDIGGGDGGGEG